MNITYDDKLIQYMKKHNKEYILVEMVSPNADVDISELAVRFLDRKQADFYKEKKRFREIPAPVGSVIMDRHPLNFAEVVRFGLRDFFLFALPFQKGITSERPV